MPYLPSIIVFLTLLYLPVFNGNYSKVLTELLNKSISAQTPLPKHFFSLYQSWPLAESKKQSLLRQQTHSYISKTKLQNYQFSHFYGDNSDLVLLAKLGNIQAQFMLALSSHKKQSKHGFVKDSEAQYWLSQAVKGSGSLSKIAHFIALSKSHKWQESMFLLLSLKPAILTSIINEEINKVFYQQLESLLNHYAYFKLEQLKKINFLLASAAPLNLNARQIVVTIIDLIKAGQKTDSVDLHKLRKAPYCQYQINPVISTHAEYIELQSKLALAINQDLFKVAKLCIDKPIWLAKNKVPLFIKEKLEEFTWSSGNIYYWLFFDDIERAYLRRNLISIYKGISTDVLRHEFAHILGFEDEYALSAKTAKVVCVLSEGEDVKQLGRNLVITKPELTFESKIEMRQWLLKYLPWAKYITDLDAYIATSKQGFRLRLLGEKRKVFEPEKLGIFKANTCDESNQVISLKPDENSFMFNHANRIPISYILLLNE